MDKSFISIILPIRNEARYLNNVLTALSRQDYPLIRMEFLVADGMSVDNTREIIHDFANLHPNLDIKILENPFKIVSTGMNIALRLAKGEIIIRVDGHSMIAPDYFSRCVAHIQSDGIDCVGGPMQTCGETPIARAIAVGMSSPFGVGNSAFRTLVGVTRLVDTVPFPAYTRQIIERAGLFDEELIRDQDDEYNYRIRELGGRILLAEDIHSTYFSRSSLKGLWLQYFQYGYWKVRVLQKHPRQMSLRQFVPPLFVLALLFSFFLFLFSALFPLFSLPSSVPGLPHSIFLLSLFVPLLYLAANLLASFYTAFNQGWEFLPFLPFIFAILHASYGAGFLMGLVSFALRWGDCKGKTPPFMNKNATASYSNQ